MNSFYNNDELNNIGFKSIGKNVLISKFARFYFPDKITIANNVRIDDFCILSGEIKLGNYIHISAYSALYGSLGIEMESFTGLSPRCTIFSASGPAARFCAYLLNSCSISFISCSANIIIYILIL